MWPVFIREKGEKLGTLNTAVIFLLFISFYSIAKTFLFKDFQINIIFKIFLVLAAFFSKKFGSKKVGTPFEIHIAKNYSAEKPENVISVSRTHAGKNKKNGLSKYSSVF